MKLFVMFLFMNSISLALYGQSNECTEVATGWVCKDKSIFKGEPQTLALRTRKECRQMCSMLIQANSKGGEDKDGATVSPANFNNEDAKTPHSEDDFKPSDEENGAFNAESI